MPSAPVAVVTDSTASLPDDVVAEHGLRVVALEVVIGPHAHLEGSADATPGRVARALRDHVPVSTSRPAPARLLEIYREAADAGAGAVVSVHLSGQISGTVEAAQLAARESPIPVQVVDTRQVGFGTGYAAVAAAQAVAGGADAAAAAEAARERAAACSSLFYVDTMEYLRRGGRVGTAAALLGGALAVKPLLVIDEGLVASLERVRTAGRALARLEELAVERAGPGPVDVGVAHLASPERADDLASRLRERLAPGLDGRPVWCAELGAVLGAHVGPGMLAVCVAPWPRGAGPRP